MIPPVPAAMKTRVFWVGAVIATVSFAVYSTIYSLTHGIYEVFPFLYFLPIILFVYLFPKRGVLFSLGLSTVFILLIYIFGNFNTGLFAVSTAWFVIFVTIGVVTSSFAESLKAEEKNTGAFLRTRRQEYSRLISLPCISMRSTENVPRC